MRRLIKFRAWDNGKMDCDIIWPYIEDAPLHDFFTDTSRQIMQYTGLKDKNGKEIYEGDILSSEISYEECACLGRVSYCDTANCIYAGRFHLVNKDGYAPDWDDVEAEYWHEYMVIGNIYENPELLEEV